MTHSMRTYSLVLALTALAVPRVAGAQTPAAAMRLTVDDAVACVSVHDEGPGIPLEEQGHIWERFYYTKDVAEQQEVDPGVGLGLYLSQTFIERHHGSTGVQSEPGHGTTFWFTLPIEASTRDGEVEREG